MMRQRLLMAILVAALIGAGCATIPPYNPFKIPQDELYGKIKTIALAPVAVPEGLQDPQPVKAMFESLIEAKLREAGFSTVPSGEYAEILKRMTEKVGGVFDPVTGKRDESKIKAVRKHCLRELSTNCNADAVLYPGIWVVKATISGQRAYWDGTSEDFRTVGKFWKLLDTSTYSGTAAALSLVITIKDMNYVDMYVNGGGIQLASKLSRGKFVPVPRNQLFANEEQNVAGVNIALDPLVTKSEAP